MTIQTHELQKSRLRWIGNLTGQSRRQNQLSSLRRSWWSQVRPPRIWTKEWRVWFTRPTWLWGWKTLHMVCSFTNTAFKDGVIPTKAFHLWRSFGDGNEITWDPYIRPQFGSPTNPCTTTKSTFGDAEFETRQDTSVRGMQGGKVHKMQRLGAWQGPLSNVHELRGGRRIDAVKT